MARAFTSAAKRAIPAAACLLAASLVVVVRAGENAHLTGRWNFNAKVSDDAGQIVRDAQQNNRQPSEALSYPGTPGRYPGSYPGVGVDTPVTDNGGVRTGDPDGIGRSPTGGTAVGGVKYPGGNGGDPGSRGGPIGRDDPGNHGGGAGNPAWDWLTRNPKFLQIDQHAKQIVITDDSGHVRTYYLDGKKHEDKDASGYKISTKAQWEGNSLVAETRTANSGVLTETFRASDDGNQIYVKTRFESPSLGGPVNIRRVYDFAPAPTK
jgi:hypothetical protein